MVLRSRLPMVLVLRGSDLGSFISMPLLTTITYDNIQVMIDLLKAGADPNLKVGGMSFLHYAQRGNDTHNAHKDVS